MAINYYEFREPDLIVEYVRVVKDDEGMSIERLKDGSWVEALDLGEVFFLGRGAGYMHRSTGPPVGAPGAGTK